MQLLQAFLELVLAGCCSGFMGEIFCCARLQLKFADKEAVVASTQQKSGTKHVRLYLYIYNSTDTYMYMHIFACIAEF